MMTMGQTLVNMKIEMGHVIFFIGSAYVYSLISGQYSFTCKLVEKTGQDASYGESVSVNSRRIAVGSPNTYESGIMLWIVILMIE